MKTGCRNVPAYARPASYRLKYLRPPLAHCRTVRLYAPACVPERDCASQSEPFTCSIEGR